MNRLLIDHLEVTHTQNWVDIQGNLIVDAGLTKNVKMVAHEIYPKFDLWNRYDPNKYKLFATDLGFFLGGYSKAHGDFGVGINLDLIKKTLDQKFKSRVRAIHFGKILTGSEEYDAKIWLEDCRYYWQHPDTKEIYDAVTGDVISTDKDTVSLYDVFVCVPLHGAPNTYFMIPNAQLIEYWNKIEVYAPTWTLHSIDKHDVSLRKLFLNPSFEDVIRIDESTLVAKKKQFKINPFGQCRLISQSLTGNPIFTPQEIQVKVRTDMEYTVDEHKNYTFTPSGPVNYVQFKIPMTTDFDFHINNFAVQQAYTVLNKSG